MYSAAWNGSRGELDMNEMVLRDGFRFEMAKPEIGGQRLVDVELVREIDRILLGCQCRRSRSMWDAGVRDADHCPLRSESI